MMLSVLCTEDAPRLARVSAALEAAQSRAILGAPVVPELVRACHEWPAGELPPDFVTAVHSDVPVLLVSGARDPVTPPELAAAAAQTLPRAIHLINQEGGHAESDECIRRVIHMFFEAVDDNRLRSACAPLWRVHL